MTIAKTPAAPYYAVIFTSLRTDGENGYGKMAEAMEKLAATQPGFLGDRIGARGPGNYGVVLGEPGVDCGVEAERAAPGGAGKGTRDVV